MLYQYSKVMCFRGTPHATQSGAGLTQETHTFNFLPLHVKEVPAFNYAGTSFIKAGNITLVKRCAMWALCITITAGNLRKIPSVY